MSDPQPGPPLEREDFGGVTVLRVKVPMLRGDETTDALFEQAYALVDDAGRSKLALNFDGVQFFASMAIGKLVKLLRKARSAGGRLAVCKLTRSLQSLLEVTHLADIIPVYADEQEAVRSFG
jgi:anti-anti-sigma factor